MRLTGLDIAGLSLSRGGRRLVEGLSFSVRAGEATALTGPNGSGKTTLLRAIAGLVRPDAGAIAFSTAQGPVEAEPARMSALHLLGHQDGLKPSRTSGEELSFQARWCGGDEASVAAAIERLGLGPLLALETRKLSAGQRRRLALARLVAAPRSLWLLDEPLAPLDAERRRLVGDLMAEHLQGGGMILAAAHDPLPVASQKVEIGGAA